MEKLQQFAIGQRWLSDTETELGLGVLIDVDERSISILFPKSCLLYTSDAADDCCRV